MIDYRYTHSTKPGLVLEARERTDWCPECKQQFTTKVPSQVICMKKPCVVAHTRKIVRKRAAKAKAREERVKKATHV